MADVALSIGGRTHLVACRDGEEAQLRRLGTMLDQRWTTAERASGGVSGERSMLFVALMLADALDEAESRPPADGGAFAARIADRLESVATALEKSAGNP
ncbi:MAG: cell division protein ZapA [Pseudomonadota bacterium]|nr:cell division protein ZapA [Pseudomonadota bacterium]